MIPECYQTCFNALKNRIFLGEYTERRRVDEINAYRDVIVIHNSEEELRKDLENIIKDLRSITSSIWIGFSCSPDHKYNLWVELSGVAFGHYWFQVKHVRMTVNELFCQVKVLRSVPAEVLDPSPLSFVQGFERARKVLCSERAEVKENARGSSTTRNSNGAPKVDGVGRPTSKTNTSTDNPIDLSTLRYFRNVNLDQIKTILLSDLSGVNLLKLMLLCFCYTVIGMAKFAYECLLVVSNIVVLTGDITIKSMYAVARLVDSISPIVLAVINIVGRIVTGLYILIAMLCGCTPYIPQAPEPVYNRRRAPPRQALTYR